MGASAARSPSGGSARGELRRNALVLAAGRVVLRSGLAGVSHRSVAAEAGLPLAATTYYFTSLEDLLQAALQHLAEEWLQAARQRLARLPDRIEERDEVVATVLDLVAMGPVGPVTSRASTLAAYERYVEAARHPALQPAVRDHDDLLDGLVADVLARADLPAGVAWARTVVATADGALIRCLAEGADVDAAAATVRTLLDAMPPG